MWVDEKLKSKVREVFGPRYKRKLSDEEVMTISENLVQFMEIYTKIRWNQKNGEQIKKLEI